MSIRVPVLPIVGLQLLAILTSVTAFALDRISPAVAALLCGLTAVLTIWYGARHVPIPSIYHLFAAAYVLLFLLHPIISPLLDVPAPEPVVLGTYVVLTVCGLLLFNVTYECFRRAKDDESPLRLDVRRVAQAFSLLVGLYGLALVLVVLDAGSLAAILNASRVDRIQGRSVITILAIYLITFSSGAFVLLPTFLRSRKFIAPLVIGALAAAEVFVFLAFRLRTFLLMHTVAVGVGYFFLLPRAAGSREAGRRAQSGWRTGVAATLAVAVLLVVAPYVRVARGLFESDGLAGLARVDMAAAIRLTLTTGDLGYSPVVYEVIRYVPRHHDFLRGQSYYRLLLVPVPRFVIREKPANTERVVAGWLAPHLPELTIPPGVQGDLYLNFGLIGTVGFILWGFLVAAIDRARELRRLLLVGTSATVVFHFVRGGFTNSVMLFITLTLLVLWLSNFVQPTRDKDAAVA